VTTSAKDERRRARALATSEQNAGPAGERLQAAYGLRLPAHLTVFDAFWRSLTPLEAKGMEHLGRLPGGICRWFDAAGRARKPKRRLDPRLDDRFRRDPPELVTVMWGMGDGLHFGLWYDDPAELPSFVVRNYARDSSETWREEPTVLRTLARDYEDALEEEVDEPPSPGDVKALRALGAALAWWTPHDDAALVESLPRALRAGPVKLVGPPLARTVARYVAHKYGADPAHAEHDRRAMRAALAEVRAAVAGREHLAGDGLTYADVSVAASLQFVRPCPALARLGPATHAAWTDVAMAREHEDILAWRDRLVARSHPRPVRAAP